MRTCDPEPPCRALPEEEEGLVISVSFTCPVKITGLTVIGGDHGSSPSKINLHANVSDPWAVADVNEPTQSIELSQDFCGSIEYPLRVTRFSQIQSLTLEFPNPSSKLLEVCWIGLKGIASGDARKAVVTVYESRANLADHQTESTPLYTRQIN
jgi:hypothetical protein